MFPFHRWKYYSYCTFQYQNIPTHPQRRETLFTSKSSRCLKTMPGAKSPHSLRKNPQIKGKNWVLFSVRHVLTWTFREIVLWYLGFHFTARTLRICHSATLICHEGPIWHGAHTRAKHWRLKDTLENCGYPRLAPIPVEGDGRYNNPLYWSRDRNPFQPVQLTLSPKSILPSTGWTMVPGNPPS